MIKSKRKLAFESGLVISAGENSEALKLADLTDREVLKLCSYVADRTIEAPKEFVDALHAESTARAKKVKAITEAAKATKKTKVAPGTKEAS